MKILYYSPHPYLNLSTPAGPGTHMREIISAFRVQGHEVATCIIGGEHIYGSSNTFTYSSAGWKGKIKSMIPDLIWQSVKDLNLIRTDHYARECLEMMIDSFKPDLIYERGFYFMTSGVDAAKEYKIPHIIEMNAPFMEEKEELEGKTLVSDIARKKEKHQATNTDMMVVVSSGLKEYYEENYPALKERVLVTPNAIDPKNFRIDHRSASECRERLGIKKDELVIGFVGSIFPYHGVERLLDAYIQIMDEEPDKKVHLLIVGDGEIRSELVRKSMVTRHAEKITFTGNVPYEEVSDYIANMDITVLANSKWYCSPIKIFEYGAMGKAIVSIRTKAVLDVMVDGEDGILVDDSLEKLKSALKQFIDQPEQRQEMAQRFQTKVMEKHHWKAMGKLILDNFESCMKS